MQGFLNINKPRGITSHKVISVLRKITGIKQIGHAGTLDPLASGVLPVATGKATKLIDYLPTDKRYLAGLEFGKKSDTYDTDGKIEIINRKKVTLKEIEEILPKYRGEIKQIPPAYSAVHYNGKRLYELARKGKIPDDIPSRTVTIYKNEIIDFNEELQQLKLDIECSKGTYIRTIINDIGEELKAGAVMFELTRTEAAGMKIEEAIMLSEEYKKSEIESKLINPSSIIPLKVIEINEYEYNLIKNGNRIKNRFNAENNILINNNGNLIAIAQCEKGFIQPKKILI